jgi:iron complex transport system substrate-binding protein
MRGIGWALAIWFIITGCSPGARNDTGLLPESMAESVGYARGFQVTKGEGYTVVEVHDPWQNSKNVTFSYILTADPRNLPDSLRHYTTIEVPVNRVIALSTTHVAMIQQLGRASSIKGISGTRYIYDPLIREQIQRGEIIDVGYDQGLNLETIVALEPDVLFIYGVENSMSGVSDKLREMGVPVVYCGEYLENHPLGKAEWIRFFALFYGLEQEADRLFHHIDSSYSSLAQSVRGKTSRPRVLTGLPWKGTWYMAGGKSFAARLIEDAGGDYLWKDNLLDEAVPLNLESVFVRAMEAEVWINPGEAKSLDQLREFDARFIDLPVLRSGEVYNNDFRTGPSGGNDYWESGTVRPDLVLADLIGVFHPDLLTDHRYIYYRKLK